METINIIKPTNFIKGYGCELCKVSLIKDRNVHNNSRKHEKNYERYMSMISRLSQGLIIRDFCDIKLYNLII